MKHILFLSTILLLLVSCGVKKQPGEADETLPDEKMLALTAEQLKNAGIVTGKMEQKQISSLLKVNGKIDVPPQNMVSISVPLGGYLKNTKLLPGMHINKGEVIAIVEDQQYIQLQQDYLTATAKINFLQTEYQRQKELNQSQASSDKVYQQAEAEYKTQLVLISALKQKLQLTGINPGTLNENTISKSINIYSPINGYVSKVNVNIGKYVSPTDVLFELINPTDIHLALQVFEKDVSKLFIGQKLVSYTNSQPERKHPCKILLIGKDISQEGNTIVHCHFEDYDRTLIPGTYMNAEIEVKYNTGFVLSEEAIVRFEGKQYVYKATNTHQFELMEVTTGETENGLTEIIPLDKNDLSKQNFVVKGAYSLLMMMKNKEE